jgi:hypothetical protein
MGDAIKDFEKEIGTVGPAQPDLTAPVKTEDTSVKTTPDELSSNSGELVDELGSHTGEVVDELGGANAPGNETPKQPAEPVVQVGKNNPPAAQPGVSPEILQKVNDLLSSGYSPADIIHKISLDGTVSMSQVRNALRKAQEKPADTPEATLPSQTENVASPTETVTESPGETTPPTETKPPDQQESVQTTSPAPATPASPAQSSGPVSTEDTRAANDLLQKIPPLNKMKFPNMETHTAVQKFIDNIIEPDDIVPLNANDGRHLLNYFNSGHTDENDAQLKSLLKKLFPKYMPVFSGQKEAQSRNVIKIASLDPLSRRLLNKTKRFQLN